MISLQIHVLLIVLALAMSNAFFVRPVSNQLHRRQIYVPSMVNSDMPVNNFFQIRGGAISDVVKPITLSELDTMLFKADKKLVVIDFSASWCPPCKMIAPAFYKLPEAYPGAVFAKIDVDDSSDIAQKYQITSMPTFVFVKNGQEISRFSGANIKKLEDLIKTHI